MNIPIGLIIVIRKKKHVNIFDDRMYSQNLNVCIVYMLPNSTSPSLKGMTVMHSAINKYIHTTLVTLHDNAHMSKEMSSHCNT